MGGMANPSLSALTAVSLIICLSVFPARAQDAAGFLQLSANIPDAPIPKPRPSDAPGSNAAAATPSATMPLAERQCRAALRQAGATFTNAPPVHEPENRCRIDHPVLLSHLGNGVALEPPALLACPMAKATVHFMRDEVGPAAERHLESAPNAIVQVSAYVCRTRHGTDTISQHALGTALDWGAIALEDGAVIEVLEQEPDAVAEQEFLDALREAACGPFSTVLGPGTDEAHADHFHFDLAERNGGTFCR